MVIDHIVAALGHLITDCNNHDWLSTAVLQKFANAVEARGAALPNCWAFIDGTARPICRPKRDQKLYYSGHKRVHCTIYQSLMRPKESYVSWMGTIQGAIMIQSKLQNLAFKTRKAMWEDVATSLRDRFQGTGVTPLQAENKWKTLERAYNRVKYHNIRSGHQHRTCDHE
ncbi:hypothetical protein V5799_033345, partial [Amblyomma americanum]